jgi:hypothetical protein
MNELDWHLLEDKPALLSVTLNGVDVQRGDRVRLRPRKSGDIMDVVLEGKVAIIESIEQDYEGNVQLAVVMEDDPGKDLGMLRQPGHRFFYGPEEVEVIV